MQVLQNGFNPGNAKNVSQHQEHPKFSAGGTATRSAPLFIYRLNSCCITTCAPRGASGCCWQRHRARIWSRPCVNTHFSTSANCKWLLCQLMVCVWNCQPAYDVHVELSAGIESHQSTVSSYHHVAVYGVRIVVMKEWTMCVNWWCLNASRL